MGGEAATKDDVAEAIEGIAEVRDGLIRVLVSISGLQSAGLKPAVSPTMTLSPENMQDYVSHRL